VKSVHMLVLTIELSYYVHGTIAITLAKVGRTWTYWVQ